MGKSHYKWPFSIAMLNYQRVIVSDACDNSIWVWHWSSIGLSMMPNFFQHHQWSGNVNWTTSAAKELAMADQLATSIGKFPSMATHLVQESCSSFHGYNPTLLYHVIPSWLWGSLQLQRSPVAANPTCSSQNHLQQSSSADLPWFCRTTENKPCPHAFS